MEPSIGEPFIAHQVIFGFDSVSNPLDLGLRLHPTQSPFEQDEIVFVILDQEPYLGIGLFHRLCAAKIALLRGS